MTLNRGVVGGMLLGYVLVHVVSFQLGRFHGAREARVECEEAHRPAIVEGQHLRDLYDEQFGPPEVSSGGSGGTGPSDGPVFSSSVRVQEFQGVPKAVFYTSRSGQWYACVDGGDR